MPNSNYESKSNDDILSSNDDFQETSRSLNEPCEINEYPKDQKQQENIALEINQHSNQICSTQNHKEELIIQKLSKLNNSKTKDKQSQQQRKPVSQLDFLSNFKQHNQDIQTQKNNQSFQFGYQVNQDSLEQNQQGNLQKAHNESIQISQSSQQLQPQLEPSFVKNQLNKINQSSQLITKYKQSQHTDQKIEYHKLQSQNQEKFSESNQQLHIKNNNQKVNQEQLKQVVESNFNKQVLEDNNKQEKANLESNEQQIIKQYEDQFSPLKQNSCKQLNESNVDQKQKTEISEQLEIFEQNDQH